MSRTELSGAGRSLYLDPCVEIYLTLILGRLDGRSGRFLGRQFAVWVRQACGLLERRGAAGLGKGAAEPAGAHEDQHEAAADDPTNAASVAARLRVV